MADLLLVPRTIVTCFLYRWRTFFSCQDAWYVFVYKCPTFFRPGRIVTYFLYRWQVFFGVRTQSTLFSLQMVDILWVPRTIANLFCSTVGGHSFGIGPHSSLFFQQMADVPVVPRRVHRPPFHPLGPQVASGQGHLPHVRQPGHRQGSYRHIQGESNRT